MTKMKVIPFLNYLNEEIVNIAKLYILGGGAPIGRNIPMLGRRGSPLHINLYMLYLRDRITISQCFFKLNL